LLCVTFCVLFLMFLEML